jgi:hypothetical protein
MVRSTESHHLATVRTHISRQKRLSYRLSVSGRITITGLFTTITVVRWCILITATTLQCLKLVAMTPEHRGCVAINSIRIEVYIMDVAEACASHSANVHSIITII